MKDREDQGGISDSDIEVEPFSEEPETDPGEAVEKAEPYFPPTDPVVRQGPEGRDADRRRVRCGRRA